MGCDNNVWTASASLPSPPPVFTSPSIPPYVSGSFSAFRWEKLFILENKWWGVTETEDMSTALVCVHGGGSALLSSVCAGSVQGPNQRRLLGDLFRDYNRLDRPVANESHSLPVEVRLTLMQIRDLVRRSCVTDSTYLTSNQLFSVDLLSICGLFSFSLAGWKEPDFNNQRSTANGETALHIWYVLLLNPSLCSWFHTST